MIRKIITIDSKKCNGCGLCVRACHEGAIGLVDGKAQLLHEHYCDGLGDCLPACPMDAISFEMRESPAYDAQAVQKAQEEKSRPAGEVPSRLNQWPCQIKLVPTHAPYFEDAHLLIAADCTAYAYGDFHNTFMRNRITLIGCPKLDEGDYTEKLTAIIRDNNIKSVTIVRMEVPCCSGLENAAKRALQNSGKFLPWNVVTVTTDGKILE